MAKEKYDPSVRHIKLGKEEGKRFKKLGDIGESLTPRILEANGFTNIKNLNEVKINFMFADFYAEKDGNKYLISVKTRNKFENNGRLNSRYKLGRGLYRKIDEILQVPEFNDCIPAWLAIAVDDKTFDAYFGLISDLDGGFGISMSVSACERYSCFARALKHGLEHMSFKNLYSKN